MLPEANFEYSPIEAMGHVEICPIFAIAQKTW